MNKKQAILNAALELFTEKGYWATPTNKIAKKAEVSEALIFKYFGTKLNLLEHIIKQGYQDAVKTTLAMLDKDDPGSYISKILEMPIYLVNSNPDFWKMQYNIIPLNDISKTYHRNFMKPCKEKLKLCFTELNYENPGLESQLILIFVDGLWKNYASNRITEKRAVELSELMKTKYNLS